MLVVRRTAVVLALLLEAGCSPGAVPLVEGPGVVEWGEDPGPTIPAHHWVDSEGRTVLHRGMNVNNHAKGDEHHSDGLTEAEWELLVDSGITFVRLLVFWEGVEPEEGVWDAEYLARLDERLAYLDGLGVEVMLDMHQDLWGEGFGSHGAPYWTCDPINYEEYSPAGNYWWEGYLTDQVANCFNGLWESEELQDHVAQSWARLAAVARDHPSVTGYEVMNEPFFGRFEQDEMDGEILPAFYEKVIDAIRSVDPCDSAGTSRRDSAGTSHRDPCDSAGTSRGDPCDSAGTTRDPCDSAGTSRGTSRDPCDSAGTSRRGSGGTCRFVALEPSLHTNLLWTTSLVFPDREALVFAPHFYPFYAEAGTGYDGDFEEEAESLQNLLRHSEESGVPFLLGEYGIFSAEGNEHEYVHSVVDTVEAAGGATAWWSYDHGGDNMVLGEVDEPGWMMGAFHRPYLHRIPGRVVTVTGLESGMEVVYEPTVDAPAVAIVPIEAGEAAVEGAEVLERDGVRWVLQPDVSVGETHTLRITSSP